MMQVIELHNKGFSPLRISQKIGLDRGKIKKILKENGLIPNRERAIKRTVENEFCCVECGTEGQDKFYSSRRYICKNCYRLEERTRQREFKKELVLSLGGECERCGYKECLSALSFHHIDPKTKDPDWVKLRRRKPEFIQKELKKCQLLCLNCHTLIHEGEIKNGTIWNGKEEVGT